MNWQSDSDDADRIDDLLQVSLPRIVAFESTFKAALKLSLEQWAQRRAGTLGEGPPFKRGHRVQLLQRAIRPLRGKLSRTQFSRLAKALSATRSRSARHSQGFVGLAPDEIEGVVTWAGRALVRARSDCRGRD